MDNPRTKPLESHSVLMAPASTRLLHVYKRSTHHKQSSPRKKFVFHLRMLRSTSSIGQRAAHESDHVALELATPKSIAEDASEEEDHPLAGAPRDRDNVLMSKWTWGVVAFSILMVVVLLAVVLAESYKGKASEQSAMWQIGVEFGALKVNALFDSPHSVALDGAHSAHPTQIPTPLTVPS